MKKIFPALIALVLVASAAFAAAAPQYDTGNQVFSFRAGLSIPDFIWFPNSSSDNFRAFSDMHLKLGGLGALNYRYFITPYIAIGGELGYVFNSSLAGKLLTEVPISAEVSLYAVQSKRFDLIGSAGLGIAFTRYNSGFYMTPQAYLSIEPVFYFNSNWGIGLCGGLNAFAEIYTSDKAEDTAIAGFSPIKLTVHYRH